MRRYDLLKSLAPRLSDALVVCNIGIPSQELFSVGDSNNNFYMLGSMGLCSSICLGLALSVNRRVVAIDGDGSVLMNLGSLATLGNKAPGNLTLLIVDSGTYGSTGDQATYTRGRTSLAEIARGAGCRNVIECRAEDAVGHLETALEGPGPTVMVVSVEPGNAKVEPIPLSPVSIRYRFMRAAGL